MLITYQFVAHWVWAHSLRIYALCTGSPFDLRKCGKCGREWVGDPDYYALSNIVGWGVDGSRWGLSCTQSVFIAMHWVHCWLPDLQGSTNALAAPTYVSWSILQLFLQFFWLFRPYFQKTTKLADSTYQHKKISQSCLGGPDNHLVVQSLAEQSTCWRPTVGWIPVKCKPQTSPQSHRQCLWKNSMWSNKFSSRNHTFYCWPQRVITTEHV